MCVDDDFVVVYDSSCSCSSYSSMRSVKSGYCTPSQPTPQLPPPPPQPPPLEAW